jgi:Region found in RelA / SpoT proteins
MLLESKFEDEILNQQGIADLEASIVERKYSNAQVNRAGDFLSNKGGVWSSLLSSESGQYADSWEKRFDDAFDVMADWRSLHALPLKAVSTLLASECSAIGGAPMVADRLKRYKSIRLKLQRFPVTNLTTIQDIAGCRAVVDKVSKAFELRDRIIERFRSEPDGPQIVDKWAKNYIANPKPDGYRSLHEVAKFYSPDDPISHCNELRVEIQIRSKMQHAWAMALETASAVTNQALKSGEGQELWQRFFFLVAEIIALNEGTPTTLTNRSLRNRARKEAASLAGKLHVLNLLSDMQHVIENFTTFEGGGVDDLYLLELDSQKREIHYVGYKKKDFKRASSDYAEAEREHHDEEDVHVVLVSVESLNDLKSAYPSFFLDSAGFIDLIRDQVFGGGR